MFDIEQVLRERYPATGKIGTLRNQILGGVLKRILHQDEFQAFAENYPHARGFEFVEAVIDYFGFSYKVRDDELEHIPPSGRVIIAANHPLGSLDALSLLKLVGRVRQDVKVVANEMLAVLEPLHPLLLAVDNMSNQTAKDQIRLIESHLQDEGAVLIFPAGSVSRMHWNGVVDDPWNKGFIRFASRTQSPILPIHVVGRLSLTFHFLSKLNSMLATIWLVPELFKQRGKSIQIRIGGVIEPEQLNAFKLAPVETARLVQKHAAALALREGKVRKRTLIFKETKGIAHPEPRNLLRKQVRECQKIGAVDGKEIYLYDNAVDSPLLREIGRLREVSFRAVGEGTGERRDLDRYDNYYTHLVLWDDDDLELAGCYRIAKAKEIIAEHGVNGLYSSTLFNYQPSMEPIFERGLELGRSFVQPRYWGRRSLDYLWYGLGAILRDHPEYRYFFGPVSLSATMPRLAHEMLMWYFSHYHGWGETDYAQPTRPAFIRAESLELIDSLFTKEDAKADFVELKKQLKTMSTSIPTLYKQYAEVTEHGGTCFGAFNIDPAFNDCIDSLVIVDTDALIKKKRQRYIGD